MRISLRYLTIFLFAILIGAECTTHTRAELSGAFTTRGSRLIDAKGNPFVIRGVNVPFAWHPEKSFGIIKELATYNVNCIRIVWESSLPVKQLEPIIQRCIEVKIIPMIELHDATGNNIEEKLQQLTRYFTSEESINLFKKYEPFVLLNIANEWGDNKTTGKFWCDAYKNSICMLRNAGYTSTLVIDAPGWGQDISPVLIHGNELINIDPAHNLLFSVHMYGSWNDEAKIERDLQTAAEKSLPIIVGEFGYNYNNGQNNLSCKVNHLKIMEVCQHLNMGYLPWLWTGNNTENNWLDMTEYSNWKILTWWGEEVLNSPFGIKKTAKPASIFK